MNERKSVSIRQIPSGVPGLDEILGGGFPEFSFNILAGTPGCGKTTLAHQIVFANATREHPALYFTVLGESALKMLRYQQQYTFFQASKVNETVRFINLSQQLIESGLQGVLEAISTQMSTFNPSVVVVDSFRTVMRSEQQHGDREMVLQSFVQDLALLLSSCEATTFLIGEYSESELQNNPIFTVADGLLWLYQQVERNSVVRRMQVVKLRGQMSVPGIHTFRITASGLQAFSRTLGLTKNRPRGSSKRRLSTGVETLDAMMGGGIPEGDSLLIAGPAGSGKSLLATQFIDAGLSVGEPGIVAIFEERPEEYAGRAAAFGLDLQPQLDRGSLEVIYLRPLDLSVDEMTHEILDSVKRTGAKRLVIDSLAGFELALAPGFRMDFRESLYRMIFALTGIGITILSTVEMTEPFTEFLFTSHAISFLTDDIIRFRYVEIDGRLRRVLIVVKMRGSAHSDEIREYHICSDGIHVGDRLEGYSNMVTGVPTRLNLSDTYDPRSK